ncbi:hypothetical protein G3R49_03740 [Shewanella sp. WXL01]|uniref:Uncharacterized protein n=1 Tax=Shewanella maritima TaxID=2520507 RepID=A0A411PF57_9GAMM|nr:MULTISPECIES: hypothetical protein [Shewanella]NKF49689.1 hypothetical protein [Shewanella sp. WXL01]QBF82227.1 hypothetical protein EXU30_05560 [Shewanella maritima]
MAIGLPRWKFKQSTSKWMRMVVLFTVVSVLGFEACIDETATLFPAMHFALFAIVSLALTDNIQEHYFTFVTEYTQAIRLVTIFLTGASFLVWIVTTIQRIQTLPYVQ